MRFSEVPKEQFPSVYLEDTDRALPARIDARTRYAYFSMIARGGRSIIQSCKDLHLSRTICYKSLKSEFADDEIEQQRFLREARVTALLQHPATIPVYELGRDNAGRPYFTMKLIHGYTFREILNYRDRYDLTQLVEVVVAIAHALDYAHTHGVAHRDVKPENIIVGPFGETLLLDWGLAKVWNRDGIASDPPTKSAPHESSTDQDLSITLRGKLEGTITYMSPEQIGREPTLDHRTDIFSLGTILYEILAGVLPAKGATVQEVMTSVLEQTPELPSLSAKYSVPPRLEAIAMRCIEKDPAARIQTAADFVRAVQEDWV